MVHNLKGKEMIRFLEKTIENADINGKSDIAKGFGRYMVGGILVPMTPDLLLSPEFAIKNSTLYIKLPGSYHGSRNISNFVADKGGIRRMQGIIDEYREMYS